MLIDTHCHLNFKAFENDLDNVISKALQHGVSCIIIPGTKLSSSIKACAIATRNKLCYAAIGIHPHHAATIDLAHVEQELALQAEKPKVVAIGEIGLDFYQYKNSPVLTKNHIKRQKELLFIQLSIAKDQNLPVILHCRGAYDEMIDFITKHNPETGGVFHCFEGEKNHLKKILDLGLFVGFDGNITYPENKRIREIIRLTPIERIVAETDSPYLTPLPFRGKRNEPALIRYTIRQIADFYKKDVVEIANKTHENALHLFPNVLQ